MALGDNLRVSSGQVKLKPKLRLPSNPEICYKSPTSRLPFDAVGHWRILTMGASWFLMLMGLWLAAIAGACLAAKARLRQDDLTPAGRAALFVATSRNPCSILLLPEATAHQNGESTQ